MHEHQDFCCILLVSYIITLTHITTIQVHRRYRHLRHGMLPVHLRNPTTSIGCKPIRPIQ